MTSQMNIHNNKKVKKVRSVETLFRNALRSNLELTSLADSKASILISVNGFILTVIVTALGLQLNNYNMIYPFIAIILTALASILLATLAIRPRYKEQLIKKEYLPEYNSVLYFQDMVSFPPEHYVYQVKEVIEYTETTQTHIINHLHILGSEINRKYSWLQRAYTIFALGLSISVILVIYAMISMNQGIS